MKELYEKPDINIIDFQILGAVLSNVSGGLDDEPGGSTGYEEW